MAELSSIFESALAFDPSGDLDAFLKQAPAKWVVYLFADEQDRPLQLLCVRNLRASLKRRLGGDETIGRRIPYRQIVRRIHFRRVDNAFEADWVYFQAARQLFPTTYRAMVGFRPAWFIHINSQTPFPRYTRSTDLTQKTGQLIGPVEDKHAAARLIQLLEDTFDLCRYYNILVQAPRGKACAYKEMGKCPAPCDGSISMDEYHRMIEASAAAAVDPQPFIDRQTAAMRAAASELKFEAAAKIKSKVEQASQLGAGAFRHARRIEDFQYLSIQRGPRQGIAKVFLITPGRIEELAGLVAEPAHPGDILRLALGRAAEVAANPTDEQGAQVIGLVAHHLFVAKHSNGIFLLLCSISESALARAYRELCKQKLAESAEDEEGIVKELQGIE